MNAIMGVFLAEFRERSRRFSFLAMTALALFAAFCFVPRNDDSLQVMVIQPDRFFQADNPSWIPIASAWSLGFFLPLAGFFYMRNLLTQDKQTGLTQFVLSSPIGKVRYIAGKWLAGIALLYSTTAVVILGSFVMMLIHFPGQQLPLYDFLSPYAYLIVLIPYLLSAAIFFDSVRFLRGAAGSILFIAAFISVYTQQFLVNEPPVWLRLMDISGSSIIIKTIEDAVLEQSGLPLDNILFLGSTDLSALSPAAQLVFHGTRFSSGDAVELASRFALSAGLMLLSAPALLLSEKTERIKLHEPKKSKAAKRLRINPDAVYQPIRIKRRGSILWNLKGELILLFAGQKTFWRFISLGGLVTCLFAPLDTTQAVLLPLLMLWFVNVFSALGSREHQYVFLEMIVVNPNGAVRQMLASWFSGIFAALLISLPVIVRRITGGNPAGAAACFAGAVFVPSLALFLGEMTKVRRVYEMFIIIITYIAMNDVSAFMYFGDPAGSAFPAAVIYLAIGLGLGAAATVKRSIWTGE